MSTRHVWERHDIKENYKISKTSTKEYTYSIPNGDIACTSGDYYKISDSEFTVYYSLEPQRLGNVTTVGGQSSFVNKYLLPTPSGTYNSYYEMLSFQSGNSIYVGFNDRTAKILSIGPSNNFNDRQTFYINRATLESTAMGDFDSYASYSYSTAYPNDGIYGSYWYLYKGSDNIDPYSLRYSNDSPNPGDSITIQANTRTPTYGGTIRYQFSYSINGGNNWTNIGSKSTSSSVNFTIPSDAEKFMARVVASDTWGFASSTYVKGANLSFRDLLAYIGVNDKARSVSKIYVGVDGKAREVKAGYVGVNGKARKFM